MTWKDPIVEGVREIRDRTAARFDYDVKAIDRYYQQKQRARSALLSVRSFQVFPCWFAHYVAVIQFITLVRPRRAGDNTE